MNSKEALRQSGRNLNIIRIDKGFSIEALAVLSQLDENAIVEMERGNFEFPVSAVYDIAAVLNVDFRKILVDPMAL
jgi:transcriptional regulator with XRE-family HTH domain